MKLNIKQTFNLELPADPIVENTRRQVFEATHSYVSPKVPLNPKLILVSKEMASAIVLDEESMNTKEF